MKKYLLTLCLFLTLFATYAQSQYKPEIGPHKSGDTLFWNKKEPVYVWISPNNEDFHRLGSPQKYAVPFYFDTEGVNYIRTKWMTDSLGNYTNPQEEVLFKVYADSKAPKSRVKFHSEQSYRFNGKTYYTEDLTVEIVSKDALSGIREIYYAIDSADFVIYNEPFHVGSSENIHLQFYAVDNVGNMEEISTISYEADNNNLQFGVDNTAPKTFLVDRDSVFSPRNPLLLSAQDSGVGVFKTVFRIDSSDFKIYGNGIKIDTLADGYHTLQYYSVDRINNAESIKSFKFYLDRKAPEIQVIEEFTDGPFRKIEILARDNYSGVDTILCDLDGTGFHELPSEIILDIRKENIRIKVRDKVGNEAIRIIQSRIQ